MSWRRQNDFSDMRYARRTPHGPFSRNKSSTSLLVRLISFAPFFRPLLSGFSLSNSATLERTLDRSVVMYSTPIVSCHGVDMAFCGKSSTAKKIITHRRPSHLQGHRIGDLSYAQKVTHHMLRAKLVRRLLRLALHHCFYSIHQSNNAKASIVGSWSAWNGHIGSWTENWSWILERPDFFYFLPDMNRC